MIVIFDKDGNKVCVVEKDKIPLMVEDSTDKKRRKYFLKAGQKTGSGLCLNTNPGSEIKKDAICLTTT